MLRRLTWLFGVTLAATNPAAAQVVTQVVPTAEFTPPDADAPAQEVAFTDDRHQRMTVPVTVRGLGPYRFLVDTGADRTAISRELAGRLSLSPGRAARLHSATGASRVETATIPELRISERQVGNVDAPMLEERHVGADGILGTDSLRAQRVLFDFRRDIIAITPATRRMQADEQGTILVRANQRAGRLIVTEAEANEQRLAVVLDSGSEISIGNLALRNRLLRRGALTLMGSVELLSVTGGKLRAEYGYIRRLSLGDVDLTNVAVAFADAHTFRQMKLSSRPAMLLGMNAFRAFDKVSIDFAHRKLRLKLPADADLDRRRLSAR